MCSTLQVAVLWSHSPEVCRHGVLASEQGVQLMRTFSKSIAAVANAVVGWVEEPGPSGGTRSDLQLDLYTAEDMIYCVSSLRILQVIFGLVFPNAVIFFLEEREIQLWEQRQAGNFEWNGASWEWYCHVGICCDALRISVLATGLWVVLMHGLRDVTGTFVEMMQASCPANYTMAATG